MKRALLLSAVLIFATACGGGGGDTVAGPGPTPTPPAVATVSVALGTAQVVAGGTTVATAETRSATGTVLTGRTVTWSSSDPSVATVNGAGLVTAVAVGSATITATSEGRAGSAVLAVTPAPVATVTVTLQASTIEAGSSTTASALLRDAQGMTLTGRSIAWASSAPLVATVNASGAVTAVAPGTATITATSEGMSAAIALTVVPVPVATIEVTVAQSSVVVGGSTMATASTRGAGGQILTGRAVAWASSNSGVASVDAAGRISGVSAGSAIISATSEGRAGTVSFTVLPVPVATVTLTGSATLSPGQSSQLTATTRDASGAVLTGRNIIWGSTNTAVATVTANGLVTGIAPGAATISANSEGRTGTLLVEVRSPVASVTVSGRFRVKVGDTYQYSVTARTAQGAEIVRPVSWSVTKPPSGVFTAGGEFTPTAAGAFTIVATIDGVAWDVEATAYDWLSLSGSGSLFVSLPADIEITNKFGQSEYADLVFACSGSGFFFAWVSTERFITSSGSVALSFDGAAPFSQSWDESNDFRTLFRPGSNASMKSFAAQVASSRVFGFAFTEFLGPAKAMLFRVTGLAPRLVPLLNACPGNSIRGAVAQAMMAVHDAGTPSYETELAEMKRLRAERLTAQPSTQVPALRAGDMQAGQQDVREARRRR